MAFVVERLNARPRPEDQVALLVRDGWPEFIFHDRETERFIGRVRELFAGLELVLVDVDEMLAAGWAVPLRWNGEVDDLPTGYNDSLARALETHDAGERPDTLVILAPQSGLTARARVWPANSWRRCGTWRTRSIASA